MKIPKLSSIWRSAKSSSAVEGITKPFEKGSVLEQAIAPDSREDTQARRIRDELFRRAKYDHTGKGMKVPHGTYAEVGELLGINRHYVAKVARRSGYLCINKKKDD